MNDKIIIGTSVYRSIKVRRVDYESQLRLAEERGVTWTEWVRAALYRQCCLQHQEAAEEAERGELRADRESASRSES